MSRYTSTVTIFRVHHMNDWLSMTRSPRCTFTDRGVLIEALDLYWLGDCAGLPAGAKELADEIGCTTNDAKSMLAHTTGYEIIEGKIHWETIEIAYEKAIKRRKQNQANGIASGLSRANERSPKVQPTDNQPITISQDPVATSQNSLGVSTGGGDNTFEISRRILE